MKRIYQPVAIEKGVHTKAVAYCEFTGMMLSRYVEKLVSNDLQLKEMNGEYVPDSNPKNVKEKISH